MQDYNSVKQNLMVKHKNENIYIQTIPMVKLCFTEVTNNLQHNQFWKIHFIMQEY
jgi:hypothetical protein